MSYTSTTARTYYIFNTENSRQTEVAAVENVKSADATLYEGEKIDHELSAAYLGAAIITSNTDPPAVWQSKDPRWNAATPPDKSVKRTRIEFYAGLGCSRSVTTVSASANVTVAGGVAGLCVGQGISGTGIPSGAIIIAIVDSTTLTLSGNCTASGTVTGTFADGPLLAVAYQPRDMISPAEFTSAF